MNHLSRTLLKIIVATAAIVAPALAQPTTTVTFSAPMSCAKGTAAVFTALTLSTNINFPTDPRTGIATGGLNFADITLTKNVDDCSVPLYSVLFAHANTPSAVISFYNAANKEVMRITLSNVVVTSISDAGTANLAPVEKITLAYGQIEILDPMTGADKTYVR